MDAVHERLRAEGWDDVRGSYGYVLLAARDGALTITAVAELLGVTKQAASQLVEGMVGAGYVRRQAHSDDARAKVIVLSERGGELLGTVERIYAELEAEWARHVGRRELEALRATLTRALADVYGPDPLPVRPVW